MKTVTLIIGIIILLLGLDYGGFLWESFMKPKREEMRRQVWENTRSFKEGKRQELVRYMHQYNTQPDNRKIIASTVRMQFADVNSTTMEPQLRDFLNKCYTGL